jgi:aldose 1-epimerase
MLTIVSLKIVWLLGVFFRLKRSRMAFLVSVNISQKYPVIILKDKTSNCEAEIFAFGGLLNAFKIPVNGGTQNMIDGFTDVADAEKNITNGFKSTKLSPFVCRMNKGIYRLNDHTYRVTKHFLHMHAIHGLVYDAVYSITGQQESDTFAAVTLAYEYKGTDPGYPFSYHITITWKLETGNRLSVQTAIEHTNKAAIPLADGWHPYFTLGGSVDDWNLHFSASSLLEYDQDLFANR